jgi:PTH1 family peptidyl-tRNA hydrolase
MHVIVGLGNPGGKYAGTRHNVGYHVVDTLAQRMSSPFEPGKADFWVSRILVEDEPVILIKPTAFMNNSGLAVLDAARMFDVSFGEMLIVYDDFHLPLGSIRLRPGGSDGGHNGLASIIYHAETDAIPRLRCGIGNSDLNEARGSRSSFVLSAFSQEEASDVLSMVDRAADAVLLHIRSGVNAAMNIINRPPEQH